MGLDMYLFKCNKMINQPASSYNKIDSLIQELDVSKIEGDPTKIDLVELSGIQEASDLKIIHNQKYISYLTIFSQVGYWRKANQIHDWFVQKVQGGEDDCGLYLVSKDQMLELISLCGRILEDKSLASSTLPTCSGFFFGGTDYDECYFEELKDTIQTLQKVILETDFDNEVILYNSSW